MTAHRPLPKQTQPQMPTQTNTSKTLKTLAVVLLAIAVLFTAYVAGKRGLANAWYYQAEYFYSDWEQSSTVGSQPRYHTAVNALDKALSLDPSHPKYWHLMGRLKLLGVNVGYEPDAVLDVVKQHFLKSTENRPMWPDTWLDLARLNNYMEGLNDDTRLYMHNALQTGPYIDLVVWGVAEILLDNWMWLSDTDKSLLEGVLRKASKQPKALKLIFESATRFEKQDVVCDVLAAQSDGLNSLGAINSYCRG